MIEITKYESYITVQVNDLTIGDYFEYDNMLCLTIPRDTDIRDYINIENGKFVPIHSSCFVRKVDVSIRYCYSLIDKKA